MSPMKDLPGDLAPLDGYELAFARDFQADHNRENVKAIIATYCDPEYVAWFNAHVEEHAGRHGLEPHFLDPNDPKAVY